MSRPTYIFMLIMIRCRCLSISKYNINQKKALSEQCACSSNHPVCGDGSGGVLRDGIDFEISGLPISIGSFICSVQMLIPIFIWLQIF